jgi:hypothetical protein
MSVVKFPGDAPTPGQDALARDERFRDLEPEVCDLDRMGEIAERLVIEWMGLESSEPPREAELASYAVQELRKRVTEFKTRYYGAWGSGGDS